MGGDAGGDACTGAEGVGCPLGDTCPGADAIGVGVEVGDTSIGCEVTGLDGNVGISEVEGLDDGLQPTTIISKPAIRAMFRFV